MLYFILGIIVGILLALIAQNSQKVSLQVKKLTASNKAKIVDMTTIDLGNEEN